MSEILFRADQTDLTWSEPLCFGSQQAF